MKRAMASVLVASLALAPAGCDSQGNVDPGKTALAVVTAPLWIPLLFATHGTPTFGSGGAGGASRYPVTVNVEGRRVAAERGDAEAECTMGAVYDTRGFGLSSDAPKKDDAIAVQWYRAAADQGNGCGQFYLAKMYDEGRGIERDDVAADMWYCLAISALNAAGKILVEDATQSRTAIEQRMTPEQIAEARKRAQEWKPVKAAG